MTPLKDITGFDRNIQGVENDEKIRRVKSTKNSQVSKSDQINEKSGSFATKDRVDISQKATSRASLREEIKRYAQEVKQLSSRDAQEFSKIQNRVGSNFYSKPEVLNKVAESLLVSFKNTHVSNEKLEEKKSLNDKRLERIRDQIESGEYNSNKILDVITDEILKIV